MSGLQKQFLMDPTVPRPAPRFPLMPTPFTFEKPVAQVPDVSLIFDSSTNSNASSSSNNSNNSRNLSTPSKPEPAPSQQVPMKAGMMSFETHVLYDLLKRQEEAMQRLEKKLQAVTENQEEQSRKLQSAMEFIIGKLLVKTVEQGLQTEKYEENNVMKRRESEPTSMKSVEIQTENATPAVERSRSSSSSGSSLSSLPVSPTREDGGRRRQSGAPNQFPTAKIDENDKVEDLSTILRDLQLPTIQENSIFSEVSVKSIPLQDFNDSLSESELGSPRIGASASNYASDDEDEEVMQPTTTFYRNVIGNVNKMLDSSKREVTVYESTDTTIYGMSSTNLSFATKQYLQKYGLVKHRSNAAAVAAAPAPAPGPANPTGNRIFSDDDLPRNYNSNNRILDVTALRNQPKLL